jgi:hypothetical protein
MRLNFKERERLKPRRRSKHKQPQSRAHVTINLLLEAFFE